MDIVKFKLLLKDIQKYVEKHYVDLESSSLHVMENRSSYDMYDAEEIEPFSDEIENQSIFSGNGGFGATYIPPKESEHTTGLKQFEDLDELLHKNEITFSDYLNQLIADRKLDNKTVYDRSNIDKKLFSKINKRYSRPSKNTVLALIVGLRLNMEEAKQLLNYAGFSFSPSSRTDVIVSYFIETGDIDKDIDLVNQVLYTYGEKTLGSKYE